MEIKLELSAHGYYEFSANLSGKSNHIHLSDHDESITLWNAMQKARAIGQDIVWTKFGDGALADRYHPVFSALLELYRDDPTVAREDFFILASCRHTIIEYDPYLDSFTIRPTEEQ